MDKSIKEFQSDIIQDFQNLSDQDKYIQLIEISKDLPDMSDDLKIDENLMPNCQSRVWVVVKNVEGRIELFMDADSLIMKGMLALIYEILNGRDIEEVKEFDEDFFEKIGVMRILSPVRGVGLRSIINYIKKEPVYAKASPR